MLIKIQIENDSQKLHNLKDLVEKAIKGKANAGLHSLSIIWEINQQVTYRK